MPGYTDKSRKYLRIADEHACRAEAALTPRAKSTFLQLAQQYRAMAGLIDDPAQWRGEPQRCTFPRANGCRSSALSKRDSQCGDGGYLD